jgi:hypothetical protein
MPSINARCSHRYACSSALLGYGLESLVDVWSSILVLWRFWGDPEGEGSYFLTTRRREARASVGIAFTFILIGFITCWQVRTPPLGAACLGCRTRVWCDASWALARRRTSRARPAREVLLSRPRAHMCC